MRTLLLVATAALGLACVHKYAVPEAAPDATSLAAGSLVYVAVPSDGRDDSGRSYAQSGAWTADALATALASRSMRIARGTGPESEEAALAAARARGATYLVRPEISHWSDRVTEWSGIPDRITIRVVVHDAGSGRVIDDREIRASSRWATLGGDHPQELLAELAAQWARAL